MTDEKKLREAVNIIIERILTPVLYVYCDEILEFICFSDSKTDLEDFADAEAAIYVNLGLKSEILDIREFPEDERVEIINNAELAYAEDEFVKMLFETAMMADNDRTQKLKKDMISRKLETGTYYIN